MLDAVLLTESPEKALDPGVYVAPDGTPAYGLLKAMVAAGDAFFLGERVEIDGRRYLAVSVGLRPNLSSPVRIRLVLDPKYQPNAEDEPRMVAARVNELEFSRYRQEYQDWEECWWREAIQNSVDAGATRIDCVVEELPDGQFRVSCEDNGSGMDADILMNTFLVRGATSKSEQDLGGFGQAKKLLLYAWAYWEIQSRDLFVKGEHEMHWERPVPKQRITGTRISVLMPRDIATSIDRAKAFVAKCHLPRIRFTMNGESYPAGKLADGDEIQSYPWGKLFFAKGQKREADFPGTVLVRVPTRGREGELFMFELSGAVPSEIPGQVILKVTADPKQILTVSRQGFRDRWKQSDINGFLMKIAADKKSALKKSNVRPPERIKYEGTGKLSADLVAKIESNKRQRTAAMLESMAGIEIKKSRIGSDQLSIAIELLGSLDESDLPDIPVFERPSEQFRASPEASEVMLSSLKILGPEHLANVAKQLAWTPDFFLYSEIEDWKIPAKFRPESMSRPVRKLVLYWAEMCRFVMMMLNCGKPFGVGFMFDDGSGSAGGTVAAAAYHTENGEDWLLINPFVDHKNRDGVLGISSDEELNEIFAMAVHECTHMASGCSLHNEDFTSALTTSIAKTAGKTREIAQIKKAVLDKERKINEELEAAKAAAPKRGRGGRSLSNIIPYPGEGFIRDSAYGSGDPWNPPSQVGFHLRNRADDYPFVTSNSNRFWAAWERENTLPSGRGKTRHFGILATMGENDPTMDVFYVDLGEHPLPNHWGNKGAPLWGDRVTNRNEYYSILLGMAEDTGLYPRLVNELKGVERVQVPRDEVFFYLRRETGYRELFDDFLNVAGTKAPDLEAEARAAGVEQPAILDAFEEQKPTAEPSRDVTIAMQFGLDRFGGRYWKMRDENRLLFDLYDVQEHKITTYDTWVTFNGRDEVQALKIELDRLLEEINSEGQKLADRAFLRLDVIVDAKIDVVQLDWLRNQL